MADIWSHKFYFWTRLIWCGIRCLLAFYPQDAMNWSDSLSLFALDSSGYCANLTNQSGRQTTNNNSILTSTCSVKKTGINADGISVHKTSLNLSRRNRVEICFQAEDEIQSTQLPNFSQTTTRVLFYLWTWPVHANASCQGQDRPLELLPTVSYLDNILPWTLCLLWPQAISFHLANTYLNIWRPTRHQGTIWLKEFIDVQKWYHNCRTKTSKDATSWPLTTLIGRTPVNTKLHRLTLNSRFVQEAIELKVAVAWGQILGEPLENAKI